MGDSKTLNLDWNSDSTFTSGSSTATTRTPAPTTTLTPTTIPATTTTSPMMNERPGILVISGTSPSAVEFWSSTNGDQESCQLSDYPREMFTPTVNIVGNSKLIACYSTSCDIYQEGA